MSVVPFAKAIHPFAFAQHRLEQPGLILRRHQALEVRCRIAAVVADDVLDVGPAARLIPGSGVADSKRSNSRDGSSSAIKMPAVKSS